MRKFSVISFTEIENTQFMLTCFRKSWHLWHNVETYGRAGHVTDVNIIRRIHFAYWVNQLYGHRHDVLYNDSCFYMRLCYFCTYIDAYFNSRKQDGNTCMKAKVVYERLSYSPRFYVCLPHATGKYRNSKILHKLNGIL